MQLRDHVHLPSACSLSAYRNSLWRFPAGYSSLLRLYALSLVTTGQLSIRNFRKFSSEIQNRFQKCKYFQKEAGTEAWNQMPAGLWSILQKIIQKYPSFRTQNQDPRSGIHRILEILFMLFFQHAENEEEIMHAGVMKAEKRQTFQSASDHSVAGEEVRNGIVFLFFDTCSGSSEG